MRDINRGQVIVVIMVWVISMIFFRVNDPYKLQLLLLISCLPFIKPKSILNFTLIDGCVLAIWLLDIVSCIISNCTTRSVELSYNTTIGVVLYTLARHVFLEESFKKLFLKILCLLIAIAFCISIFAFVFYKQVLNSVGFFDTYPFRYLFCPLGYITNVWSTILFPLLGILSISCYILQEKIWKWITGILLCVCVISILLSFSRGAYIALGLYVIICFLFMSAYAEKIKILVCCLLLGGTVYLLFPKEVETTVRMNQTTIQLQSNEGRITGMQAALNVYKSDVVFGAGLGKYTLAIDQELNQNSLQKYTSYAPNIVLHLLLEKGIIGVLVYVFLLICILLRLWKQRTDYISVIIGTIFLAICVKELTISVALVSPLVLCLSYILLALLQKSNVVIENSNIDLKTKHCLIILGIISFVAYESFFVLYDYNEACNKESIDNFKKKKYLEAITAIERTSEWTPYLINRVKLYLNCYEKQFIPEYLACAESALIKVQKRNPDDVYLDYLFAKLSILKRDHVKAYGMLKKIIDHYPQNVLYKFTFARFLCDIGQRSDALPYLQEVLLVSPRLLNMQTIERLQEIDISLYQALIYNLKQQKNIGNNTPAIMARNGSIAFYLGEFELSKECLKEALLRQPNLSIPWLLLGKIYAGKGELEKSDLCFKRYNILMKGVFSLSPYDVTNLDLFGEEQKYLEVDYSSKFQDWYRSKLLY